MIQFLKGQGTYPSPMSDYWKNWLSHNVLGSVKYIWNVEIFNLEPHKICFCFLRKCILTKRFVRRLLPQTGHMGVFTKGGNQLVLNYIFCCSAMKPLHSWIYFQNFCNFVFMLMNAREQSLTFFVYQFH